MKLEVGAVIYLIDPRKRSVIPAQVQEQLVSRTIKGEKVSHNVVVPSGKIVCLEDLDTPFFKSLEEVRTYLLDKAKEVIDMGVKGAEKIAKEKFQSMSIDAGSNSSEESMISNISEESLSVTLEDGTRANITLPTEFLGESINS
jgi:GTP1/Obg family GTP-binding protein